MKRRVVAGLAIAFLLTACHDEDRTTDAPKPQAVTDTAIGQFCGMSLVEHPGPKGQIFVRGDTKPFWFASVRDAVAFTMLPEMPKNLAVIYVTDMGRAHDWNRPEPDTWIEAHQALFVIGSARKSGMDTNEAIPFSDPDAARHFTEANGGRIVHFADIPQSYVLTTSGDAPQGEGSLVEPPQRDAPQRHTTKGEAPGGDAFLRNASQRDTHQADAFQGTPFQRDARQANARHNNIALGDAPDDSPSNGKASTGTVSTGNTP